MLTTERRILFKSNGLTKFLRAMDYRIVLMACGGSDVIGFRCFGNLTQDPKSKWPILTEESKTEFSQKGYIVARNILSNAEVDKTYSILGDNPNFWKLGYGRTDRENKIFKQIIWSEQGYDILGLLAGSSKTAGFSEQLLGKGELYFYHGKLIYKEPKTGGKVVWHQDYGYWYDNEAIFPDFISCLIALTKSNRENGGLQVIESSHLCGRINHGKAGDQQGADMERVSLVSQTLPHIYLDLKAGDAVFFHSNLLHASGANMSDNLRCHLILSYNTKVNSPNKKHHHALYSKLTTYPADAVDDCDNCEIEPRDWLDAESDAK